MSGGGVTFVTPPLNQLFSLIPGTWFPDNRMREARSPESLNPGSAFSMEAQKALFSLCLNNFHEYNAQNSVSIPLVVTSVENPRSSVGDPRSGLSAEAQKALFPCCFEQLPRRRCEESCCHPVVHDLRRNSELLRRTSEIRIFYGGPEGFVFLMF